MTDNDFAKLAELINNRNPVSSCADSCIYKKTDHHDKAHEILDTWMANDLARKNRWAKIHATVLGGIIISAAGAIGTGALNMIEYLREHLK